MCYQQGNNQRGGHAGAMPQGNTSKQSMKLTEDTKQENQM